MIKPAKGKDVKNLKSLKKNLWVAITGATTAIDYVDVIALVIANTHAGIIAIVMKILTAKDYECFLLKQPCNKKV